jgi:hypothetical protein
MTVSGVITSSTAATTYALTLNNGYTNQGGGFDSAACYVDASGIVHVQGVIGNNGGNFTTGQVMATLPANCPAPSAIHRFLTYDVASTGCGMAGVADVETNGTIQLFNGASCNPEGYVDLDGISYHP